MALPSSETLQNFAQAIIDEVVPAPPPLVNPPVSPVGPRSGPGADRVLEGIAPRSIRIGAKVITVGVQLYRVLDDDPANIQDKLADAGAGLLEDEVGVPAPQILRYLRERRPLPQQTPDGPTPPADETASGNWRDP